MAKWLPKRYFCPVLSASMPQPYRIFTIYAREDAQYLQELRGHLRPLEKAGRIAVWSDREINPGVEWEREIIDHLVAADIVLVLVSAAYFQSAYIHEVEIELARKRHDAGEARMLPIIVRQIDFSDDPIIGSLQVLPTDAKPVAGPQWHDRDHAWADVVAGLKRILDGLDAAERERREAAERAEKERLAREKAAAEAKRLLEELARDMVLVKAGTFMMGCTREQGGDCYDDEKPAHPVTLTKDFYLGKYPVTNTQYAVFLNEKGNQTEGSAPWIDLSGEWSEAARCRILAEGNTFRAESGYENHPVVYVSWYGAKAYCDWLSAKSGKSYRLPTEVEWEYAARGGHLAPDRQTKYAGSDNADEVAWYWENSGDKRLSGDWSEDKLKSNNCQPRPVGRKKTNTLGLYDMSGNVWEWCNDWYDADYYKKSPTENPKGPSNGSARVVRGGSWLNDTGYVRVSDRDYSNPTGRYSGVGFRAARDK